MKTELRYCHDCTPSHAENCPECFGFGLTATGIVRAIDAGKPIAGSRPCPVCGGTPEKGSSPATVPPEPA